MTGSLEGLPLPEASYGLVRRFLELTGLPVEDCLLVVTPDQHGRGCTCRVERRHQPSEPAKHVSHEECSENHGLLGRAAQAEWDCGTERQRAKDAETERDAARAELERVKTELHQAQNDRQKEHEKRTRAEGSLAAAKERLGALVAWKRQASGRLLALLEETGIALSVDQALLSACAVCNRRATDNAADMVIRGWTLFPQEGVTMLICPICWANQKGRPG